MDPEAVKAGFVILIALSGLILTGAAILQVQPKGQTVSQSYELDYHLVNDDSAATKYSSYNGPPLYLEQTIHDNAIPKNGETKITFRIVNPADHRLRGRLTVKRYVGFGSDEKTLFTIDYDLAPDTQGEKTVTVRGQDLYGEGQTIPVTSKLSFENDIWSDEYHALHPDQNGVGNDAITVRKPLFDRFGFYWLCLVGLIVVTAGIGGARRTLS